MTVGVGVGVSVGVEVIVGVGVGEIKQPLGSELVIKPAPPDT